MTTLLQMLTDRNLTGFDGVVHEDGLIQSFQDFGWIPNLTITGAFHSSSFLQDTFFEWFELHDPKGARWKIYFQPSNHTDCQTAFMFYCWKGPTVNMGQRWRSQSLVRWRAHKDSHNMFATEATDAPTSLMISMDQAALLFFLFLFFLPLFVCHCAEMSLWNLVWLHHRLATPIH